jgi:hypothetical protein
MTESAWPVVTVIIVALQYLHCRWVLERAIGLADARLRAEVAKYEHPFYRAVEKKDTTEEDAARVRAEAAKGAR